MQAPPTSLSRQITYLSIAFAVALVAILASFGWWAASRIDDRAMARQTRSIQSALAVIADRMPIEVDSVAVSDEAVIALRRNDERWLSENLVDWLSRYFNHDRVFALDPRNNVVRAVQQGIPLAEDVYGPDLQILAPLIQSLRIRMDAVSHNAADSTREVGGLGLIDYVNLGKGIPAIVSIRPVLPSSDAVVQPPGSEYLIVSMRFLTSSLLIELRNKAEVPDLHFEQAAPLDPDRITTPVMSRNGRIIGFFSWVPEEPAYDLIRETAPMIGLGALAAALAVGLLLQRLRRTSAMLEVTQAEASYLAFHDPLSGLANRALFEDRLDHALANMRRTGLMVALHYIDLDRFKHVNDTLGHPAGDEVIKTAAERLSALADEVDTVARLGGDEFAIIQFQPADMAAAERLSARIVEVLSQPILIDRVEALVSASVGVIVTADPEIDATDLLRQADIALYQAKDSGRGRYQLFAGELDDAVRERRALEIDLRQALISGVGLDLVYQPIYSARGDSLAGAEALVRWDHPTRGRMSPVTFIGLAEERGLIDQLGLWVLRAACTFVADSDLPWVAVNVSPLQFRSERFAQTVRAALREAGIPSSRLQLEITEGLLLQNSPAIQATLTELRAEGIRIALDDFGTGYSSISYLRTHGIDKLKIDQSFTAQLGVDAQIESIIRSIVDLGRAMNMVVTAEGVETPEQQAKLIEIGCDELQGYLLAQPLSADAVKALMERRRSA